MSKVVSLALVSSLAFGILATAFSVCQGLMPETCGGQSSVECSVPDDFCQKMCRLGQNQAPVLFQKKRLETVVDLSTPTLHTQRVAIGLREVTLTSGAPSKLNSPTDCAQAEVYLLNAAFLI